MKSEKDHIQRVIKKIRELNDPRNKIKIQKYCNWCLIITKALNLQFRENFNNED